MLYVSGRQGRMNNIYYIDEDIVANIIYAFMQDPI